MKTTTHTLGYEDLQKLAKRQKLAIRALLTLSTILIVGIAWIIAYKAAEGFWLKTIIISAVQPRVHTAKASELTLEEYVCTKNWDCKTALAVMTAESHKNPYAINKNTDGSLDLGCWQLNEKWQKIDRSKAFDCRWSTDKAFEIYEAWGGNFNAWSAFKSQSFKKYL